ncbi:MAG: TIGR03618 family F420-dependent PPOX class oxidoreductase [Chloroflexi bacterium]|nr:TIGR03618 family F420-dependent PPOX class oxidoreductase [Chloroflexota bacterium]MYF22417.1 TIGR03618 family F420-dependent PPOX class oxidoreductase [Chloroflexota bacterium]
MASVPAEHADLVGAPNFAHLVTVNRDGSPQSSPIWIRPDRVSADGAVESIFFVTGLRYRKALNMQREPRVALSIHGADDPYRMLEVVGTASFEPRSSWDELDAISNQYMGRDYPFKGDDPAGWHVTVEIERVTLPNGGDQPPSVDPPAANSDLLSPPHFAHVATVSSTGQPRSSVVWHRRPEDGGENDIEFWTGAETLKTRHLRNNPAVAVSIHDEADPYRYTEIRGEAQITPIDGREMADELTRLYWKLDEFPMDISEMNSVAIRVATTHRVG